MTQRFLNREISWLKFNGRVLFQARDPRNPLLERVRFLNIYHSNLDEFFMKRVGGLKRQHLAGVPALSADGMTPEDQLRRIRPVVEAMGEEVRHILTTQLLPDLAAGGITLRRWDELNDVERDWARAFFRERIFGVLTPMAVDPGHPFPLISNLSTSLAISLKAPGEDEPLFARIKIPDVFPTWLRIPDPDPASMRFISVLDVITQHLDQLFPKMNVVAVMPFRVTRNADIDADTEDLDDLLELIEEEVRQRRFAEVVRLEHGPNPDPWLRSFLMDELDLTADDVYQFAGALELRDLAPLTALNLPALKFKAWTPVTLGHLADENANVFNIVRANDVLVHHPYESFATSVERFIMNAAVDPAVVAIKMTLYRTSKDSPIVHALIRAAESGKQVVCLVELKARFDEERNIYWAQAMEKAGVHVVYGVMGLKTHSKLTLVIRQEREEFKAFAHIGTGNYHPQTAKLYTDFGLFTSRPELTQEVIEIFHYLTGRSLKSDYPRLLVAPINMKAKFLEMIREEIGHARAGRPAGIVAKCNSLEDPAVSEALYEASAAGVSIDLIVRGFCCLKPGVPGLSENIRVTSILGPFLEHSRIFYFRAGADDPLEGRFFIGSADWMSRNLLARVEVVVPLLDRAVREKLWETLQLNLNDRRLVWDMSADGSYLLRQPTEPGTDVGSQDRLCELTRARAASTSARAEA